MTAVCRGCGEDIRPCNVPDTAWTQTLHGTGVDPSWGNAACCLLGWRHIRTGFHGCPDVDGKVAGGFAKPADESLEYAP